MSVAVASGTFTGTAQSASVRLSQWFNFSVSGFGSATVSLERSFDDGGTWLVVESFTSDAEKRGYEAENNLYRVNCSSYTSGTISYRISR